MADVKTVSLDAMQLLLALSQALAQVTPGERCPKALDLWAELNLKLSSMIDPRDSRQCFLTLLGRVVPDHFDNGDDQGTGICPVPKSWYTEAQAWQQRVGIVIANNQGIDCAARISFGCEKDVDTGDFLDQIMPRAAMLLSDASLKCSRLYEPDGLDAESDDIQSTLPDRLAQLREWIAEYTNAGLAERRALGLSDWLPGSPFLDRPVLECLSELSVEQILDASLPLPPSAIRLLLAEIDLMTHRAHIAMMGRFQHDDSAEFTPTILTGEVIAVVPAVISLDAAPDETQSTVAPILSAVAGRFLDYRSVLDELGSIPAVDPLVIVGLLSFSSLDTASTDGDTDMPDQARADRVYGAYAVYPSMASIRLYVCPLPGVTLGKYYDMIPRAVERIHLVVTAGLGQSADLSGIQGHDWTTTIHSMGSLLPSRTPYFASHTGPMSVYFAWLIASSPAIPLGRRPGPALPADAMAEDIVNAIKIRQLGWLLQERHAAKTIWTALKSGEGWRLSF